LAGGGSLANSASVLPPCSDVLVKFDPIGPPLVVVGGSLTFSLMAYSNADSIHHWQANTSVLPLGFDHGASTNWQVSIVGSFEDNACSLIPRDQEDAYVACSGRNTLSQNNYLKVSRVATPLDCGKTFNMAFTLIDTDSGSSWSAKSGDIQVI